MPNRITRAALLFASSAILLAGPLSAQEKAAPKVLTRTTTSDAAKAALTAALDEVANFGGVSRVDAKLKAVVDADPNFALGRAIYGAYTNAMPAADRNRELEAALAASSKASAAEVLFILALREWRAGRTPVARELTDAAIKQAPDEPILHWFRTNVAVNAAEALTIGENTVKLFPDFAPSHNTLAYRLNAAGRQDDAYKTVQRYIALAPNHPNPHDSYAEILQLNGRYDEAVPHYQRALEIDPKWEAAHEGLAEVAFLRGKFAEARTHLGHAMPLAATPGRRLVLQREIASSYLHEGKLKEAKAVMLQVAAEAEANSINAIPDKRTVAMITALEGKTNEAASLYSAAMPPNPGPAFPVNDAIFHALLKHPAEVSKALAAIEANAARTPDVVDTQEAMRATRVISAVASGDLNGATSALSQVTTPGYKALAAAFVAQAARKAGNQAVAKSAMADVEAFNNLTLNSGMTRFLARRK